MNTQKREFGTFIKVDEEVKSSGNYTWKFFYLDISQNPQYPKVACFKLEKDKITLADNLRKGQQIMVDFRIDGRFFKKDENSPETHFQSLVAWQISVMQSSSVLPQDPDPVPPVSQATPAPPKPVQERMDFSKPVEEPKTELVGDLPDFVKTNQDETKTF